MLRRSLIGAALALPAARVAQACSNPPVGRYEPEQAYGDCGESWIGNQYPEYYAAINTFNMVSGATQIAPGTRRISGLDDPWLRAQLQPGEYADFGDLANMIQVGGGLGAAWGVRRGGARGAGVGAALGGGGMALLWLGYNWGVGASRYPMGVPSPITSYNGWSGGSYYPQGTFGIPFGVGEWFAIDFNMFGGGGGASPWCVRLY